MLVAGGLALSLAGFGAFAGVASADEGCILDGIPSPGSTSTLWPEWGQVVNPSEGACTAALDGSDTSMTDIDEVGTWGVTDIAGAGSYPGHNAAFTATPQTKVP
ncbi:MAG: hypothetical protein QOC76_140 [Mycobacterium sp.]|jgi:hypothetical protein|nr:hypothetical protein [Mycobacterium sp.]